jgi:hypothetical protein
MADEKLIRQAAVSAPVAQDLEMDQLVALIDGVRAVIGPPGFQSVASGFVRIDGHPWDSPRKVR